jgi:hypothetical protein
VLAKWCPDAIDKARAQCSGSRQEKDPLHAEARGYGTASARICGSWQYRIERHSSAQSSEPSVTRISQSGTIEGAARPLPG